MEHKSARLCSFSFPQISVLAIFKEVSRLQRQKSQHLLSVC